MYHPQKVFLVGFMGSGKSHWGKIWAEQLKLPFIEQDALIEQRENKTIAEIFDEKGEAYFRELESEVLKNITEEQARIVSTGGGAPCFFDNMQWMNDHGTTIYLKASPAELVFRLKDEVDKRPVLKNAGTNGLELFIQQKLAEREPFYERARFKVPVSQLDNNTLQTLKLF